MNDNQLDQDESIDKIPNSDPFPEILIVEQNSGSAGDQAANAEEEEIPEEEEESEEVFSSIPDSTPNSEEDFQNMNLIGKTENGNPANKQGAANARRQTSNCCLLI